MPLPQPPPRRDRLSSRKPLLRACLRAVSLRALHAAWAKVWVSNTWLDQADSLCTHELHPSLPPLDVHALGNHVPRTLNVSEMWRQLVYPCPLAWLDSGKQVGRTAGAAAALWLVLRLRGVCCTLQRRFLTVVWAIGPVGARILAGSSCIARQSVVHVNVSILHLDLLYCFGRAPRSFPPRKFQRGAVNGAALFGMASSQRRVPPPVPKHTRVLCTALSSRFLHCPRAQ